MTNAQLRAQYNALRLDALRNGTPRRDILSFAAWKRVLVLQQRLAARDAGGNIRL